MTKGLIRKAILDKRLGLGRIAVDKLSRAVCQGLLNLDELKKAHTFAIYLPASNEVDTKGIIDHLLKNRKAVNVPAFKGKDYIFVKFSNWHDLEKGPYGILQPRNPKRTSIKNLEFVIVPGVAFSKEGVRLGYGKGVYDQLLWQSKAIKIGLAYEFQVIDKLPREKHDLKMDMVVTEARIYKFT